MTAQLYLDPEIGLVAESTARVRGYRISITGKPGSIAPISILTIIDPEGFVALCKHLYFEDAVAEFDRLAEQINNGEVAEWA